ncbi:MAG: trigger factor [Candidatus Moranbacteria bacterium]|nr:trigger factor [Candidatus Moranbacteria bacterium]
MNVTVKKLPESKVEMTMTLPWEEWQGEIEHAVEGMGKELKVPGFRKGKVPRHVIEQRFGNPAIMVEAAEHVVSHSYAKALKQENVQAIGHPEVNLGKIEKGQDFTYTLVTAVMPEITLDDDFRKAVKKINTDFAKKEAIVDDQAIMAELEKLANMRAKLVTVNREAKLGDNVLVDFTVMRDGVLIDGGKSEKHPLVLGKGVFIPGFEEKLVGMKEGGEASFELIFPAEYHAKHLAGKLATFAVKMGVVQEREVPVIDDAFAKSLGKFETLDAVKTMIHMGMLEEKKEQLKQEHRTEILDALVSEATIEYPQILIEQELVRMTHDFEEQLKPVGVTFDVYLEQMKKTKEAIEAEWTPQAKKRLAAQLIVEWLAKEEAIEVPSTEIEAEMNKALQYYKSEKDMEKNIDTGRLYSAVEGQLRNQKVLAWLESL